MKKLMIILVSACMVLVISGCESKDDLRYDLAKAEKRLETERSWSSRDTKNYENALVLVYAEIADLKEGHKRQIAGLKEKYEKAVMITPTDEWIELHGDDLSSWQTFNIKVLTNEARNKTQGVKK